MTEADERRPAAATLTGAFNFRDLGGLPTIDGRRTRSGLLFRSDTLQALTKEDVAHLVKSLSVMLVMDLRDAGEAIGEGRGLLGDSPLSYVNIPLEPAPTVAAPSHAAPAPGSATLDFYLGHLDPGSPVLPLALQILAVALTRPAVVHCAAGKDRTGLVVALVLSVIGVRDEAIVADYMATAQNMPRINERFQSWPRYREHMAAADPELYHVQEHAIQAFLRELDQRHGGARTWATRRGVPGSLLDMLTDRLLED
jgi:protein-tyrosine phosphatase